ncbi:MAG: hypothetical protein R3B45_04245 [Bdellovibrionota bacterium]
MLKAKFEHDYKNKIIYQSFDDEFLFSSNTDVAKWRTQWMQELKTWHSPYKCLIDCSKISLDPNNKTVVEAFASMLKFFEGLFLRKAIGYGFDEKKGHTALPFEVLPSEDEAIKAIVLREKREVTPGNFRSSIQFENHFRQHVVEMSFAFEATIDSQEKLLALKSKLMNNLMQWHSAWNLLIDCTNMDISPDYKDAFIETIKYFKSFFLKEYVGYSPRSPQSSYPFKVFRSRHKAVALLENEGMISGEDANCSSRKGLSPQG